MNKLGKTRLLKLANFLMKIPPKAFNLDMWVNKVNYDQFGNPTMAYNKSPEEVLKRIAKGDSEFDCGTTACAVGYCGILFPNHFKYEPVGQAFIISHKGLSTISGAMEFFNIDHPEASFLFMPFKYGKTKRSAKHVAKRIIKCVEKGFPKNGAMKKTYESN